ncbi:hypothetical protein [Micromonospora sp. WMMD708]|uniref:hypothetical protein n=1 Tax=Micromonospora sp. WMMD708 TaxID=3403464 RepID=UPI003BF4CBFB
MLPVFRLAEARTDRGAIRLDREVSVVMRRLCLDRFVSRYLYSPAGPVALASIGAFGIQACPA